MSPFLSDLIEPYLNIPTEVLRSQIVTVMITQCTLIIVLRFPSLVVECIASPTCDVPSQHFTTEM